MMREAIPILVALLLVAALTGCLASWRDANEYARQFEVSLGEAAQRLRYQDQIGELAETLAANEPDTFAGLWIEHEPAYRIVVRSTRDPADTLRLDGDQALVIDGGGEIAARAGEEVHMGGGYVPVSDEWVLQQIPPACQGSHFIVGHEVRPNLRQDTELLTTDAVATDDSTVLFPHYRPALDEQITGGQTLSGKLVAYEYRRCLHLQSESLGPFTLLWPPDWSLQVVGDAIVVTDQEGAPLAQLWDEVQIHARPVPHTWDDPLYRQLVDPLPGDCIGATWLVEELETRP